MDNNNNLNDIKKDNTCPKLKTKKIKYRLKKVIPTDIFDISCAILKTTITCSFDFLVYKFGKPSRPTLDDKTKGEWVIKIMCSNNYIDFVTIYDYEEYETELKDITCWYIGGNDNENLKYEKIAKLIYFEYSRYTKQLEKSIKDNSIKVNKFINKDLPNNNLNTNNLLIDEEKYNKINQEKFVEFTDDDLACILFVRLKNSNNILKKEVLIIHRSLVNPNNYNKSKQHEYLKTNILKPKRDKTKYNNKK